MDEQVPPPPPPPPNDAAAAADIAAVKAAEALCSVVVNMVTRSTTPLCCMGLSK